MLRRYRKIEVDSRFSAAEDRGHYSICGDSAEKQLSFIFFYLLLTPFIYRASSSFTEKDYEKCVANMEHGMFRLNWSIYDWEEARRGDMFYMMRVGDDKAGIVFSGQFITDPYPADDWGGSTKRRMYVDMVCMNAAEPEAAPLIPLEKLQKTIPTLDWSRGHSGILLANNVTDELAKLM